MKDNTTPFIPPSNLQKDDVPISMIIHSICHEHDFAIRTNLDKIGVTMAFGPVLRILHQTDGLTQSELAQKLRFRASSISVTIRKMENLGYIVKQQDKSDARVTHIFLTEHGISLEKKIKQTFKHADNELIAPLLKEEKLMLKQLLLKIHNNQTNRRIHEKT